MIAMLAANGNNLNLITLLSFANIALLFRFFVFKFQHFSLARTQNPSRWHLSPLPLSLPLALFLFLSPSISFSLCAMQYNVLFAVFQFAAD